MKQTLAATRNSFVLFNVSLALWLCIKATFPLGYFNHVNDGRWVVVGWLQEYTVLLEFPADQQALSLRVQD